MSDDAFRLTPLDVRTQQFARRLRGYDPPQVDEFMLRISEELDRLLRENGQHEERLRSAQEQLRVYRDRERAMNEALVAAQQLRAETRDQAEREAEQVLRDARAEAERVVARARLDEQMVRERSDSAVRQFTAYVASFRALLERHLGEVDGLALPARMDPPQGERHEVRE
ncbi:MAG TPA: DivIVA domain-containing protein [Gemmatimonadales bacterium]|jgi:DivIVA domain-containing protein|nr:DivIVA domain-containing protein [Gemmatimonadales bacterium]